MSLGNSEGSGGDFLSSETFHTPSFGDEDFDLAPMGMGIQQVSENVAQSMQENTFPSGQALSRTGGNLMDLDTMNLTQPLSHPPNMARQNCSPTTQNIPPARHMTDAIMVPKFPPPNFEVPDISLSNSVMSTASNSTMLSSVSMATSNSYSLGGAPTTLSTMGMMGQQPLMTISQSQISSQLGFQSVVKQGSPAGSHSTHTSSPSQSSEDSDDSLPLAQLAGGLKRTAAPTPIKPAETTTKKQKVPKKKKKKDPNEPQKPVSAYALFFRDTQAAIKGQNPNASFGEVSKIVASMWDGLDPDHKNVYKKKTENAKKDYLKQLAAYRASLVSKQAVEHVDPTPTDNLHPSQMGNKQILPNPMTTMPGGNNSMAQGMMSPMVMPPPQQMQQDMMGYHGNSSPMLQTIAPRPPPTLEPMVPTSEPMMMSQGYMNQHPGVRLDGRITSPGRCVRDGCTNHVIENPGWDNEYCSNDCVVSHCRDVFTAWVASNRQGTYAPVK
ncbi:TOX high mobility group box family member 4-B-like isoform X1 [Liolophura sinensis]|uniref:TOX high mobility group box family member 4-B-like isoform X1 n=1 Tax=Liolophura sinensis TaxID=3198878 RepID=UPI0031593A19